MLRNHSSIVLCTIQLCDISIVQHIFGDQQTSKSHNIQAPYTLVSAPPSLATPALIHPPFPPTPHHIPSQQTTIANIHIYLYIYIQSQYDQGKLQIQLI